MTTSIRHSTGCSIEHSAYFPATGTTECASLSATIIAGQSALRQADDDCVLVAFNFGAQSQSFALPRPLRQAGEALPLHGAALDGGQLHLPPASALLMPVTEDDAR